MTRSSNLNRKTGNQLQTGAELTGPDAPGEKTAPPSALLPHYLAPGLDVVFVGAAPSLSAARAGHYYAGPTNKFWKLLHQTGFTPRQLRAEEDGEVLRWGVGLTEIYSHLSTNAVHLLPAPNEDQRENLRERLAHYAPRWICYNGKIVYEMCTGRVCTDWGEQDERQGDSGVFVVHSSSARADAFGRERLTLYRELRELTRSSLSPPASASESGLEALPSSGGIPEP